MRKIGEVEKYNKVSWDKIGRYKSWQCVISLLHYKTNYMSMKLEVNFDESFFFLIQEKVTLSKIAKKFIIKHWTVFSSWLSFFGNYAVLESTMSSSLDLEYSVYNKPL